MNVKIKPLGEYILVVEKVVKEKDRTESGIYLPGENEEKSQIGKVLEVGDSDKIKVKKGQSIVFRKFSENEIEIEGEKVLLLKSEDVLAVIEG